MAPLETKALYFQSSGSRQFKASAPRLRGINQLLGQFGPEIIPTRFC
jgi:hypothetical protein